MFQTFREYLETLGIVIPKEETEVSYNDRFIDKTNTEYTKLKDAVISNEDFADIVMVDEYEPSLDSYSNMDGEFTGVTYPLTESGYIRFNTTNIIDNNICSLNIFVTGNDQPIAEIVLDGADITYVISEIISILKTGTVDSCQKDIEIENPNIRRYLPYETVESVTEEGISYNKDYGFTDMAGAYSIHNIKTNTKKSMVEELWSSGRSLSEILDITKFSGSIVKNTLKSINAIKTVDIRPGKIEK